jgi:hypothetical protein
MITQKTFHLGRGFQTRYREQDVYFHNSSKGGRRSKMKRGSRPEQVRLNRRNSFRHFHQLIKANFYIDDLRIDLTYDDGHVPKDLKEAHRYVYNFLLKLMRYRRKNGLDPLKYICVNENFDGSGRPHHHLIVNGGVSPDTVQSMWSRGKGRKAVQLGRTRTENLRFDNDGIEGLARYITKQTLRENEKRMGATEGQMNLSELGGDITPDELLGDAKGRKAWWASKNLIQPHERIRENAMSKKQVMEIVRRPADCGDNRAFFERRNPGYIVDTVRSEYNAVTGLWGIYVTMHRRD